MAFGFEKFSLFCFKVKYNVLFLFRDSSISEFKVINGIPASTPSSLKLGLAIVLTTSVSEDNMNGG